MEFTKQINNEQEYLNFIFNNNFINLPIVRVDKVTGVSEYVMVNDLAVKAVDFLPQQPCNITLVAYPDDNDKEVTYRMLQIKYI